MTERSRVQFLV